MFQKPSLSTSGGFSTASIRPDLIMGLKKAVICLKTVPVVIDLSAGTCSWRQRDQAKLF